MNPAFHPGYYAHLPAPAPTQPPSPSQQRKMLSQREYRIKEMECFNTLRHVLRQLTGEELRTRYDILNKAIDILSATASELEKLGQLHATTSAAGEAFTQSPNWQLQFELDAGYDAAHHHDLHWQNYPGSSNQASSQGGLWQQPM